MQQYIWMLCFVWAQPSWHVSNDSAMRRVILGTLVSSGGTKRWSPGLWPDEREEGDPATADGGVLLHLLGPGPHSLGAAAAGTMCWWCLSRSSHGSGPGVCLLSREHSLCAIELLYYCRLYSSRVEAAELIQKALPFTINITMTITVTITITITP